MALMARQPERGKCSSLQELTLSVKGVEAAPAGFESTKPAGMPLLKSRFLELPCELRQVIYGHVLGEIQIHISRSPSDRYPGNNATGKPSYRAIFLVCFQITGEALASYWHSVTWIVGRYPSLPTLLLEHNLPEQPYLGYIRKLLVKDVKDLSTPNFKHLPLLQSLTVEVAETLNIYPQEFADLSKEKMFDQVMEHIMNGDREGKLRNFFLSSRPFTISFSLRGRQRVDGPAYDDPGTVSKRHSMLWVKFSQLVLRQAPG